MFPRSTSGRAPSSSSIIRFWINAVSLNRPPTLFTISSLLSASIIVRIVLSAAVFLHLRNRERLNSTSSLVLDNSDDLIDRLIQTVVNHHVVKRPRPFGHVD